MTSRGATWTAATLAVAGFVAAGCAAPNEGRVGGGAGEAVTLALEPYFRDLQSARIVVGGDTLRLLLDTGGGATLVSPTVARRIGCKPSGADVGHRMSGEAVTFQRCDSLRMTSGAWSSTLVPVGVFDLAALLPPALPHLDGVLALDAFRGRAVTIDWSRHTLTVRSGADADSAVAHSGVRIRVATGETGRFLTVFTPVQGRHELLWFLIDSGNLRGTLVSRVVLRDSLLATPRADSIALGIGGRPPVTLPFAAENLVIDGALGVDYLKRGPVTIDLR